MDSILNSVKKLLGISAEDTSFDQDVAMHINTTFAILSQIGVGPSTGFSIQDSSTTWSDYLDDPLLVDMVRTYVYCRVRMQFDPPQNSTLSEAIKNNISELEWRMNVVIDHSKLNEDTKEGDDDG